jgi:hypothetical protein
LAVLRESFDVAAELRLPYEMFEAAACLLDLAVDCEDLSLAQEWVQVTNRLRGEVPISALRWASCAYLHARVCTMNSDFEAAREQLVRSRMLTGAPLWTRARQCVLALEVFLATRLNRGHPKRETIRRLRRLHLRTRRYGASDFEFGVLASALIDMGQYKDVSALVADYELLRRTRLRRHSILQQAMTELSAEIGAMTL